MSYRAAVSHRLRWVYLPLLVGWLFHLWAFTPDERVVESASLPGIDRTAILGAVAVVYVALFALAVPLTAKERGESGGADHGDLKEST